MTQLRKTTPYFIGILVASLSFMHCSKKKNDDKKKTSSTPAPTVATGGGTTTPESTVVTLSGSLNLGGGAGLTGFSLADDAYNVYCVTFADSPSACKADVDSSGSFNKDCDGFSGQAFGCFLRQNDETLSTIEFTQDSESNSTMVGGAGTLEVAINYDAETGRAIAKVDTEKSTSLASEAVSRILSANKTDVDDLTGIWNLKCVEDDLAGMTCSEKTVPSEGMDIYLSQFTAGKRDKVAIWESKPKHDLCIASGNEAKPSLQISLDGESFSLAVNTKEDLESSLDRIYTNLPTTLQNEVREKALARAKADFGWCEEMEHNEDKNPFRDGNCKFVVAEMEQHTIWDESKKEDVTVTEPRWYAADEFDSLAEFTGTGTAQTVSCSIRQWQPGVPHCPPGTKDNGDGTGDFTSYQSGDKPLFLVCKDPRSDEYLIQMPAPEATKAKSLTAMSGGDQAGNDACKTIESGTYKGLRAGYRDEIRRTVLEVFSMSEEELEHRCNESELSANFTFNDCNPDSLDQPRVCWDHEWIKHDLNLKVGSDGKLIAKGDANFFHDGLGSAACPDYYKNTYLDARQALEENGGDWNALESGAAAACQAEFTSLSAYDQATKILADSQKWRPAAEQILCNASTSLKNDILNIAANSCVPQVMYDQMCDKNGCKRALRCSGSANGRCFDDDGNFTGRLPGRFAIMNLKPRVGGAFELSETITDTWQRWDPENNQPVKCTFVNTTVMNSKFADADDQSSFEAIFTQGEKEQCEDPGREESTDEVSAGGDSGGEGQSGGRSRAQTFKMQAVKK